MMVFMKATFTPTETERVCAEAHGIDAFRNGVIEDACRAYSDRPHIQEAWKVGWRKARDAATKRLSPWSHP